MTDLKSQIITLSKEIGISKIGFTTADNFDYLAKSLKMAQENGTSSGFEHKNIAERTKPELLLKNAKTIISIAVAYPNKLPQMPQKSDYKRGKFSPSSWGMDYHHILTEKMALLSARIAELTDEFDHKAMVDTGALVDTAVARRAGIGFIGKNGLVISKEFGSYMFLGELVTNLNLAPDRPVTYDCGDCNHCVTSCPTSALNGDSTMNAKRCLSFQTQTTGQLAEEFRVKMKNVIYGCDICQIACPYNKGIDNQAQTTIDPEVAFPELIPFIQLTNKEFKAKFSEIAGAWRGKNVLQRNAIYALANLNDKTAISVLEEIAENPRNEVHQEAAQWALSKLKIRLLKKS
ncbi:epoxyqueuosine reductase [Lactococcus hodotermopsidis]|uniref:Epoxyqueuosine reductase n=1 Tax=Pseudolactococcus hodotermopsidis TaxID=2709157 RepID=A0A6A0BEA0_9LACT|nr:tRNA epoxyqueuosine(34) reductase QueG [Lactococcus hodotermopsidis]GFH42157.1 epoxyqueuosine reductase [Lactococcus hodotermopsidis]